MSLALIYAKVPKIACIGKCQACCGPIGAEDAEVTAFEKVTGKPFPDPFVVLDLPGMTCPLLDVATGRCSVYQHRPLICRLWGVIDRDGMRCPHGCKPERWLTDAEGHALMDETRFAA